MVTLRTSKVTFQGSTTTPKVRVSKVTFRGGANLVITPFARSAVEAFSTVSLTAVPDIGSPTPTGYSWRQVSGPPVVFSDLGATITYPAPPASVNVNGQYTPSIPATVVFGVTAFLGTAQSPEQFSTIDVIPHIYWQPDAVLGWIPLAKQAFA